MKSVNIDKGWQLNDGIYNVLAMAFPGEKRIVNLPHDYMIESDTRSDAVSQTATGYYNASTKNYSKEVEIPSDWESERVYLQLDGAMMNATVEINGAKVGLKHNGYMPYCVDITDEIYPGEGNCITINTHAGTQPNSRWYSGAGLYRSVNLLHGPAIHIKNDGIYAYTKEIEYADGKPKTAYLNVQVEVKNTTTIAHTAWVEVFLTKEDSDEVIVERKSRIQINASSSEIAYLTMTVDGPKLWDADDPNLYILHARLTDAGIFKTHEIAIENGSVDESEILFGIRTVTADARRGLRINGKTVKLKGGCLHHDNGMLGAVSLYDVEYRKLSYMKSIGYNAVRTTHNPPSKVFLDACDRLGIYVFDEAFDAWDIAKEAGDYNQYFKSDWREDLTAFMKRDRSRACVIIWSTGNEIPERGGLDGGYHRATELAEFARSLDASRPISNAICSYWSGMDLGLMKENLKVFLNAGAGLQNANLSGDEDVAWEEMSQPFANGLDIVGYNYMEDKYERDHNIYPDRVILGSENYGKDIGNHWPLVEKLPYVLGDFTWTAFDYIGEAGIGKAVYVNDDDPLLKKGAFGLMSQGSIYPWKTANDADFDINGELLPQGAYRKVVWGENQLALYAYSPDKYGKHEVLSQWGFPDVSKCWNYEGMEGKKTNLLIFTDADEVEILLDGKVLARKMVDGQGLSQPMAKAVVVEIEYRPGCLTAVGYKAGSEVARDSIETVGKASDIRLTVDKSAGTLKDSNHPVAYVRVELVDEAGRLVPNAAVSLKADCSGAGYLAAFGSGNPFTAENYTTGEFSSHRGLAMAIIRDSQRPGDTTLTISGDFSGQITL